jgi:hypothetical protein
MEEILPMLAGTSSAVLVARAWLMLRVRRRRDPGR